MSEVVESIKSESTKVLLKEMNITTVSANVTERNTDNSANIDLRGYKKVQLLCGLKDLVSDTDPYYIVFSQEVYLDDTGTRNSQQINGWQTIGGNLIEMNIFSSGTRNYFTKMGASAVWSAGGVHMVFRVYGIK